MPGIFGGIGCSSNYYHRLKERFESIWGKCDAFEDQGIFLGGHAHVGFSSLYRVRKDNICFVIDGESALYNNASSFALKDKPSIFDMKDDRYQPNVACKGNVVVFDSANHSLTILTESSGTFPLYYVKINDGLLFSSLLKPLAVVTQTEHDPIGIIQFVRYGYILNGRTFFKGIKSFLPGQAVVYEIREKRLIFYENSRGWTGRLDDNERGSIVDISWSMMMNAVQRSILADRGNALMVSAGWDSRLLLSCMRKKEIDLVGYSHGDTEGRELKITSALLAKAKVNAYLEKVDSRLYDLNFLKKCFERTENIIFPYWNHAGELLKDRGMSTVAAGIFGEVIGGHYSRAMLLGDLQKFKFIFSYLLFRKKDEFDIGGSDVKKVYDFLHFTEFDRPWYISNRFWQEIPNIRDEINNDIDDSLKRLELRGINNTEQLIEAYITESRGSRYIAAQLLACRPYLDIVNIFGDGDLFLLASHIPLSIKFQNSLSQRIMHGYAPDLLSFPTAAILTSTNAPILIQETTRLLRKSLNALSWQAYYLTHGFIAPRLIGWDNFEFFRDEKILKALLADMNNSFIDKQKMERFIIDLVKCKRNDFMFNVANQMMKIYTTDLMLR